MARYPPLMSLLSSERQRENRSPLIWESYGSVNSEAAFVAQIGRLRASWFRTIIGGIGRFGSLALVGPKRCAPFACASSSDGASKVVVLERACHAVDLIGVKAMMCGDGAPVCDSGSNFLRDSEGL